MKAYALVTAAYNEEEHIEKTIRSVASQTVLPVRWIVVSDGSTDHTDEFVQRYARDFSFIRLVRVERDQERNFASKVYAQNTGIQMLPLAELDFIGFLDADISFAPGCLQALLGKFQEDPALGIAGGFIHEQVSGKFVSLAGNRTWSVAGAMQVFRRECYESIGGLLPLRYGCEDTYPEIVARMKGWHVQSFPELGVSHHRPVGSAVGVLRYRYWQGLGDYSIGYHPIFETLRLIRHIPNRPFCLAAMAQLCGFVAASLRREKRMASPEVVAFLRREQKERLLPFRRRCVN